MKKVFKIMKNSNKLWGVTLFSLSLFVISCKKDKQEIENPPIQNNEELITTFYLTFVDENNLQDTIFAKFVDLDGAGGNAPSVFDTINLLANTTYNASIQVLNESISPTDNITNEILAEAVDHLFCFEPLNLNLTIQRTDNDGTYELGLLSKWIVGNTSSGTTTIRLKHQPGIKNGTCDLGETDIELNFYTKIN